MPPAAQNETADLSIARRSSIRSLNYARENALRPGDSISVREIERKSSSPSFKTTTTQSTAADHSKGIELESQNSLGNHKHLQPTTTSSVSAGTPKSVSWLSRFHPSSQTLEDAVMGTSDGMTVPFALTASLAGIAPNARYVMLAGLAEMTAGALSMALGGALQARCEREAYDSQFKDTKTHVCNTDLYVPTIVEDTFSKWNFSPETLAHISHDLSNTSAEAQTDFAMRFHHQLSPPDTGRYFKSATTLGLSYFLAGLIGIFPYMVVKRNQTKEALYAAIAVEAVALYVFGYCKTGMNIGWRGKENIVKAFWGAASMVLVGAVASGIAVGLIIAVNNTAHVTG